MRLALTLTKENDQQDIRDVICSAPTQITPKLSNPSRSSQTDGGTSPTQ